MNKPIKPVKPTPPEEFFLSPIYLTVSAYSKLTEIIEKISNILVDEEFQIDRLYFDGTDTYDSMGIDCKYIPKNKRKNMSFKAQRKVYERDLKIYEKKYEKYKENLKAYNSFVKKQKEIAEREDVKAAQKLLKEVGLI